MTAHRTEQTAGSLSLSTGTFTKFFLAASVPFAIAAVTSPALPRPYDNRPRGGRRKDPYHVLRGLREETPRAGQQTHDYRAESQHP